MSSSVSIRSSWLGDGDDNDDGGDGDGHFGDDNDDDNDDDDDDDHNCVKCNVRSNLFKANGDDDHSADIEYRLRTW